MVNYAKELDKIIERIKCDEKNPMPGLLLHSCCAPCSSYVLEYLREYFAITVFYYNPNVSKDEEYKKRVREQIRLIEDYNRQVESGCFENMNSSRKARLIDIIEGDYEPECFYELARGLEKCREGGERCFKCYELRLCKTAKLALEKGFDYFTTTLTISPLKNAQKLNEIGERLAEEYKTAFLPSDFKKKNGYKRSVELSAMFGLYRQDYCGCVYSKQNVDRHRKSDC